MTDQRKPSDYLPRLDPGQPVQPVQEVDERLFPKRKQMSDGSEGLRDNDLMVPGRLAGVRRA